MIFIDHGYHLSEICQQIRQATSSIDYFQYQMNQEQDLQYYKHQLKSIHIMKHIRQMDLDIRKNWQKMYRYRSGKVPACNPESQSSQKRLNTEPIQLNIPRMNSNPRKIQAMKAQINRQRTHQRKRKNEEIFFKKKTNDFQSLLQEKKMEMDLWSSKLYKSKSKKSAVASCIDKDKKKTKEDQIPFMLRKRTVKAQKQISIISHSYEDNLKRIKSKQDLKSSLNLQQKMNLINKMRGSKIYYQFVREWRPPIDDAD